MPNKTTSCCKKIGPIFFNIKFKAATDFTLSSLNGLMYRQTEHKESTCFSVFLEFVSVHPIQPDTDILRLQPIPVCSIYGKAQGHVSDLVVQDTEAQSRLAFLQLNHLSLSLPHGQRR